jgi:hypothetical protein
LRYTGQTTESPVRRSGEDNPTIAPRRPDCEEWIWMVDEDPAFYLSEAPGA